MLVVETIAKIRRLHFTEGKGIKTICRDLSLSKKVVRKVTQLGTLMPSDVPHHQSQNVSVLRRQISIDKPLSD